jgi:uncharacterized SAM-binding protein YcdF (DUF218 family)
MRKFFFDALIIVIALAIFIVACTFFLAPNDIAGCETPGIYDSSTSKCQKVDAIVSISGGNTAARTTGAIKLYQQGWAEKIIFSGAAADISSPSNANVMKAQAIKQGVPAANILIDEDAKDTNQNADLTAKIITDNEFKKIILTTSGYHQRRAYLEFSRALYGTGVEIINAPAHNDSQWNNFWWLSPRGWQLTLSELAGIVMFFVKQGVNNG